jgi:hypothetical protein
MQSPAETKTLLSVQLHKCGVTRPCIYLAASTLHSAFLQLWRINLWKPLIYSWLNWVVVTNRPYNCYFLRVHREDIFVLVLG